MRWLWILLWLPVLSMADQVGSVTFMLGDVLQIDAGQDTTFAQMFSPVHNGDILVTEAESRCEITLADQSVIRMDQLGQIRFASAGDGDVKLETLRGDTWYNIKHNEARKEFKITSPTALVAIRGTTFRVNAGQKQSDVLVYKGTVDVKLNPDLGKEFKPRKSGKTRVPGPGRVAPPRRVTLNEWVQIMAGMKINVRNDGTYDKSEFDSKTDSDLDWVKWNQERDQKK